MVVRIYSSSDVGQRWRWKKKKMVHLSRLSQQGSLNITAICTLGIKSETNFSAEQSSPPCSIHLRGYTFWRHVISMKFHWQQWFESHFASTSVAAKQFT
jgi:hypothetical protein